jgi:hypothetical protein
MISSANDIQITSYNYGTQGSQSYPAKQGISNQNDGENPSQPSENVEISEKGKELQEIPEDKKTENFGEKELTREEEKEVKELEKEDKEVKAHEMAHVAAGGGVIRGGPTYDYRVGPDGKRYAVGGHVNIDTGSEREPEATIRKMQQVKRAALAPADPSGTDRVVAAKASRTETKARGELRKEKIEEAKERQDKSTTENKITDYGTYHAPVVGETIKVVI